MQIRHQVPEEFDPAAYELGSYGLEVTTGGAGLDEDASAAAFEAARAAGIRVVSGFGDEVTGTTTIEVIDATVEQVEAWESSLDEPGRVCMVRAPRAEDCDDVVVADARERAERQGELFPAEEDGVSAEDGSLDPDRAEVVGRSYLGLTEADAREKATAEARSVRTVIEEGVGLGVDDDLQPSRMNLSVCDGVIVDARLDGDL